MRLKSGVLWLVLGLSLFAIAKWNVTAAETSQNFDGVVPPALPAGWTTALDTGPMGDPAWRTTTTQFSSVPNSVFATDPAYVTDKHLDCPPVLILNPNAKLKFANKMVLEQNFDGGVLEISIASGPFTDIVAAGGVFAQGEYNGTISTNFMSPIGGRAAWTGDVPGGVSFINTEVMMPSSALGKTVTFRWRCATDISVAGGGWFIDNVEILNNENECVLTCPANITVSNDLGQCGAVVNYPAPGTNNLCGTVTCAPPSGSFFPVGTTTVTCDSVTGSSCMFDITVIDTEPPVLTCPPNQFAAATDPGGGSAVVNYPPPTASDNCPGIGPVVCIPPSGSVFPAGTTVVDCRVTDAAGNTSGCSFAVTVFNISVQQNGNPNQALLFSFDGSYRFCCNGTLKTGTGFISRIGNNFRLGHFVAGDRRVFGQADLSRNRGTAELQAPPGTVKCRISDTNLADNTATCP